MSHWSILGSGVTGLCVATALADAGEKLEIITSDEHCPASHYAGGMLAPFCEGEGAPEEVVRLGQGSADWWQAHVSGVARQGTLVIAPPRDSMELNRFAKMTQGHEWVDPGSVEDRLAGRFARGLFFPSEGHLDPRKAMQELRQKLLAAGVEIHHGKPTGKIIDCRGIHAAPQLPELRAVRGEMLILQSDEVQFSRPVRLLHPRFPCYLVPRSEGRFMLGATMVESNDASPISARALMELLSAAYTIDPALAEARVIETGSGLRPSYPNNLPDIRYRGGTFHVNGMYRHGFLLAPIVAQNLIQQLSQETR